MHPQGPNLNVNFKMDNYQVSALRHKRHIVACNVQLDQETIAELTSRKLINKAMLENVKVVDVQSMCQTYVAIFAIFHKVVNSMF